MPFAETISISEDLANDIIKYSPSRGIKIPKKVEEWNLNSPTTREMGEPAFGASSAEVLRGLRMTLHVGDDEKYYPVSASMDCTSGAINKFLASQGISTTDNETLGKFSCACCFAKQIFAKNTDLRYSLPLKSWIGVGAYVPTLPEMLEHCLGPKKSYCSTAYYAKKFQGKNTRETIRSILEDVGLGEAFDAKDISFPDMPVSVAAVKTGNQLQEEDIRLLVSDPANLASNEKFQTLVENLSNLNIDALLGKGDLNSFSTAINRPKLLAVLKEADAPERAFENFKTNMVSIYDRIYQVNRRSYDETYLTGLRGIAAPIAPDVLEAHIESLKKGLKQSIQRKELASTPPEEAVSAA